MKKLITLFSMFALLTTLFVSCNDNDGDDCSPTFCQNFYKMYPYATDVNWAVKGDYEVATFDLKGVDKTAWFSITAINRDPWEMTDTELPPVATSLPELVQTAFATSEYSKAPWSIDDIDLLERFGMEDIFVIEVENATTDVEMEIVYATDGTLLQVQPDVDVDNDNSSHLPSAIPAAVQVILDAKYPNAKIVDVDNNNGTLEIDIVDGVVEKEVTFDANNTWVSTVTEGLGHGQVAAASMVVMKKFEQLMGSDYLGYAPDMKEGIDFIETPAISYYVFELVMPATGAEATLKIDTEGNKIA